MLRTLRVRDLAIIDELEVVLEPGLNVITGETGAGKSILLQALDVALGGRPDADLVRSGAEEGAVEALFTVVPAAVRELLRGAGIAEQGQGGELIVRRVIAKGGRTRAYINGALGSLPLLRELAPPPPARLRPGRAPGAPPRRESPRAARRHRRPRQHAGGD